MFEKIAYAADAAAPVAGQPNPLSMLPMFALLFIVMYFFIIRPQQNRQKTLEHMIKELKKGDKVVTAGGLIGTINSIQEDYLVLKVGDNDTKLEVLKSSVSGLRKA